MRFTRDIYCDLHSRLMIMNLEVRVDAGDDDDDDDDS